MIRCVKSGTTATVFLEGELDHSAAQQTKRQLDSAIADTGVNRLVVDMKGLRFMDSSGLGVLIGRYKTMEKRGGTMAVRNVSQPIDRIFNISGIYSVIEKI